MSLPPHPIPLPLGWGEGARRAGEGIVEVVSRLVRAEAREEFHSQASALVRFAAVLPHPSPLPLGENPRVAKARDLFP